MTSKNWRWSTRLNKRKYLKHIQTTRSYNDSKYVDGIHENWEWKRDEREKGRRGYLGKLEFSMLGWEMEILRRGWKNGVGRENCTGKTVNRGELKDYQTFSRKGRCYVGALRTSSKGKKNPWEKEIFFLSMVRNCRLCINYQRKKEKKRMRKVGARVSLAARIQTWKYIK